MNVKSAEYAWRRMLRKMYPGNVPLSKIGRHAYILGFESVLVHLTIRVG